MKHKVIATICDGVICATKSYIICYHENGIRDTNGEDCIEVGVGQILTSKQLDGCDTYWQYSRKEWDKIDREFRKIQKIGVV